MKSKRRLTQQPSVSPSTTRTKPRRATTTGLEQNDKINLTYGSKSPQDIFEFRGSSDEEHNVFARKSSGSVARSRDTEDPHLGGESHKSARATVDHEGMGNFEAELHEKANQADSHLWSGYQQDETSPTVMLHSSMFPPMMQPTVGTHTHRSESSTPSTVPFSTSAKPTPTKKPESFEFPASDDRMPTPTVFSKSRGDLERPLSSCPSSAKSSKRSRTPANVPNPNFGELQELERTGSPHPSKRARSEKNADVLSSPKKYQYLEKGTAQKAQPSKLYSKVDTLVQSLPYTANRAAIEKTLEECGGNINLAASILLDAEEHEGGHDELAFSEPSPIADTMKPRLLESDEKRQLKDKQHIDELGSDEIDVGLPKEQYQPRPSRSRSGQVESDVIVPADFSKRPETLVKPSVKTKKSKRRKTTALAKATPKYESDEEEITPLFSVAKSTESTNSESKTAPDYVKSANIETLRVDTDAQSDHRATPSVNIPVSKKQRGRPHKKVAEPSEEVPEEQLRLDDGEEEPTAEIAEECHAKETSEVLKPSASAKQKSQLQKKSLAPLEEPILEQLLANNDEEPDGDLTGELQEEQGKEDLQPAVEGPALKKQRGRPKKKPASASEHIISDVDTHEEEVSSVSKTQLAKNHWKRKKTTHGEQPSTTDNDTDNDPHPPTSLPSTQPPIETLTPFVETQPNANTANGSMNYPTKNYPAVPPSTPSKPTNAGEKGPDKHSPLRSGKVGYRVGLSKKARIEPLLRVVRK